MTDELVTIFYATGLTQRPVGGGVGVEDIRSPYVHRTDVVKWCRDREAEGKRVDFKIFAALYLARSVSQSSEARLWY